MNTECQVNTRSPRESFFAKPLDLSPLGPSMTPTLPATKQTRLTIPQYAMALAHVASLRSEDPFRKVGAVADERSCSRRRMREG